MNFNIFQPDDKILICKFSYKNINYFAKVVGTELLIYTVSENTEGYSKTQALVTQREVHDYCNAKSFKDELESFCLSLDELETKEMQKVYILEIGRRYDDNFYYTFYTGSRNIAYDNPNKKYAIQEIFIDNWGRTIKVERSYDTTYSNKYDGIRGCETYFIDTSLDAVIESAFMSRSSSINSYKEDIQREEKRIQDYRKNIKDIEDEISKVESCRHSILFKEGKFELEFERS